MLHSVQYQQIADLQKKILSAKGAEQAALRLQLAKLWRKENKVLSEQLCNDIAFSTYADSNTVIQAYCMLAELYAEQEHYTTALQYVQKGLSVIKDESSMAVRAEIWYLHGYLLFTVQQVQAAQQALLKAYRLYKTDTSSQELTEKTCILLAKCYILLKKYQAAEECIHSLRYPNRLDALLVSADFYSGLRKYESATALYQQVMETFGNNKAAYAQALYGIAQIALQCGKAEDFKSLMYEVLPAMRETKHYLRLQAIVQCAFQEFQQRQWLALHNLMPEMQELLQQNNSSSAHALYHRFAGTLLLESAPVEALEHFIRALEHLSFATVESVPLYVDIVHTYRLTPELMEQLEQKLPESLLSNKEPSMSLEEYLLSTALIYAELEQDYAAMVPVIKELIRYYSQTNNFEKAFFAQQRLLEIQTEQQQTQNIQQLQILARSLDARSAQEEAEFHRLQALEFARINEELKLINKEKDEIFSVAAHDLKNPLSGILLSAGSLLPMLESQQKSESHSDMAVKLCKNIILASEKMLQLIRRLLDTNALDNNKLEYRPELGNISNTVEGIIGTFKEYAASKRIAITYLPNTQHNIVTFDELLLCQIVDNLLSNAIKFSPTDSSVIVRLDVKKEYHTYYVELSVQDQGPGIKKEDEEKLFKKFQRLSAIPTAGEDSTGLGLYGALKIITLMNGSLRYMPATPNGAIFIAEFPTTVRHF